ncbi:MAG: YbfB/YjiJ family MFS transporter [Parvibaculaceae bacterium]
MSEPSIARDLRLSVVLGLAGAIGLGVARFGYALVLPDMRQSLGWSYADAGFMNTANAAGYLIGAFSAALMVRMLGSFRTLMAGAVTCIIALALSGLTADFTLLSIARFLGGVGAAFGFVAGGVMAAAIASRHARRGSFLLSLFYIGPGIGIFTTGLIVPLLLDHLGPGSWESAWLAMAAVALVFTVALLLARGESVEATRATQRGRTPLTPMLALLSAYLVFGAGYIGYTTFMIAWVQTSGGSALLQSFFWSTIGIGAMLSPWVFSPVIARYRGGLAFAALAAATVVSSALPLLSIATPVLLVSAFVFGGALTSVVASTTAFVRNNYPAAQLPGAIGAMTTAFGLGQVLGPVATGHITDLIGGLAAGLWVSVGLLAACSLVALLQRDFGRGGAAPD